MQLIKQKFMPESILIDRAESIKFLMTHIQEALGEQEIFAKLLLRGSRDGMTPFVFHQLCDNKGPLLVLFKTNKDILCGGFSSVNWNSSGLYTVDKKCFIFSLKLRKVYKRKNDNYNLYMLQNWGPYFGNNALALNANYQLTMNINADPFHVPMNK